VAAQKGSLLPTQLTTEMPLSLFCWILVQANCVCVVGHIVGHCCWLFAAVGHRYNSTGTTLAPNDPREFCAFLGRKHVAAACFHPHIPDSVFRICFYWFLINTKLNARRNVGRHRVVRCFLLLPGIGRKHVAAACFHPKVTHHTYVT
jgi:hypothetical protein